MTAALTSAQQAAVADFEALARAAAQKLPVGRLVFSLRLEADARFPEYLGSMLRGAFGHALKKVCCVLRTAACENCPLETRCVYRTVFETPVPEAEDKNFHQTKFLPHPYVVSPLPGDRAAWARGDNFEFELVVIGKALEQLPYLACAVQELGRMGLGKGFTPFTLTGIFRLGLDDGQRTPVFDPATSKLLPEAETPVDFSAPAPAPGAEVLVTLLTPLRIKSAGQLLATLTVPDFLTALVRRLHVLLKIHAGPGHPYPDLAALAPLLRLARANLAWRDWERYSNRQQARMKLGGLMGSFTLSGPLLPALWPMLTVGAVVHVGKNTSFGLGRFCVTPGQG